MWLGIWMTSCSEAMGWGFWVIFEKKEWVEIWSWTKRVDFWTWTRPVQLWTTGFPRVVGSDGTVSIVEIVCLSLLVSKNLKVKKVIKVSYLNYRESSVFRVFRDSNAYVRFTHLYILHNHIFVFGYITWLGVDRDTWSTYTQVYMVFEVEDWEKFDAKQHFLTKCADWAECDIKTTCNCDIWYS